MKINNHELVTEVYLVAPDDKEEAYAFETVEAVAAFVESVSKMKKYRDHTITICNVKDNDDAVDGFLRAEQNPITPLTMNEIISLQCERAFLAETLYGSDEGEDPFEMSLTLGILGEKKHEWLRFGKAFMCEWERVIKEINDYLKTVDLSEYGEEVDVRIFPVFDYMERYKNKAAKSILISHNAIRPITVGDVLGFIKAGIDASEEHLGNLVWVGPKEMFPDEEEERRTLFGDAYKRADFVTSSYNNEQEKRMFDFVSCELTEKGSFMIAEGTPISWMDGRDESAPEIDGMFPGLRLGFSPQKGEQLEKRFNALLVTVSKEYVESNLFETEVLPFAEVGNVILVYMDDTRLSEERLSKLEYYTEITYGDPEAINTLEAFEIDKTETRTII